MTFLEEYISRGAICGALKPIKVLIINRLKESKACQNEHIMRGIIFWIYLLTPYIWYAIFCLAPIYGNEELRAGQNGPSL
jgi:hypothetical protein